MIFVAVFLFFFSIYRALRGMPRIALFYGIVGWIALLLSLV